MKKNSKSNLSRRKLMKSIAAVGSISAMPGFVNYSQASSSAPIRIGFQVHRTGIGAAYGRWYDRTTQAAVKIINDSGGINGRPIEIISEDDGEVNTVFLRGVIEICVPVGKRNSLKTLLT